MSKISPMKNKKTVNQSETSIQLDRKLEKKAANKAAKLIKKARQAAKDHKYRESLDI